MNQLRHIALFSIFVLCAALGVAAQPTSTIVRAELSQSEIDRIIKAFTTKEGEFREALKVYAFNRNAKIQTVGLGGQITGTYQRDSYMTFKEDGSRFEKILYFPIPTMRDLEITPEDLENLNGIDPFAIEPSVVGQYNFAFVGKEKIDELNLYVFDVTPKVIPDWKKSKVRLFSGRIWIDDQDLMIVESKGKAVPEGKQRFPIMETWRENVDAKYWFPSFSMSDDELVFDNGQVQKIKVRVKYGNYRVGRSDVKILDGEEEVVEEPKPTPSPTPKKPDNR